MHKCAAKCCLDEVATPEAVSECTEKCNIPLRTGQALLQKELEDFQVFPLDNSVVLSYCKDISPWFQFPGFGK